MIECSTLVFFRPTASTTLRPLHHVNVTVVGLLQQPPPIWSSTPRGGTINNEVLVQSIFIVKQGKHVLLALSWMSRLSMCTGISSQMRTKFCDWAVWQAKADLSSNYSKDTVCNLACIFLTYHLKCCPPPSRLNTDNYRRASRLLLPLHCILSRSDCCGGGLQSGHPERGRRMRQKVNIRTDGGGGGVGMTL